MRKKDMQTKRGKERKKVMKNKKESETLTNIQRVTEGIKRQRVVKKQQKEREREREREREPQC